MRRAGVGVVSAIIVAYNAGCSPEATHFVFTDADPGRSFVIELSDEQKIAHARRILSGEEQSEVHVRGVIVKSPAHYDPDWSYHLDPDSIEFFEMAIEVCDATMTYVEKHLDEVGSSFLPGSVWCPWSSVLAGEQVLVLEPE